jgi:uncharacterized repeat protein (TIGR03803 family)
MAGGTWIETILHSFNYGQGGFPEGGPVLDAHGRLYGTTYEGGLYGDGVVYRLAPPTSSGGTWTYRALHSFTGHLDGGYPRGSLVVHGVGVLYGTTSGGGAYGGGGTVFQLVPPAAVGAAWTENVLCNFGSATADAGEPTANILFDSAGNIYGTTLAGGDMNAGAVFELTPPSSSGGDWTETVLHSFGEIKMARRLLGA